MSSKPSIAKVLRLFIAFSVLAAAALAMPGSRVSVAQTIGPEGPGETAYQADAGELAPEPASALAQAHPNISRAQMDKLHEKKLKLRETTAASSNIDTSGIEGEAGLEAELASASEATVGEGETGFHGTPSAFLIPSNVQNTRANLANGLTSTLAEPAAANEGPNIFYAGNIRHNEFSTNGGATWTNVTVPGGPADAPIQLGDWDVVYDQARGVTFRTGLYVNSSVTNGVIRLFVRRDIAFGDNCTYLIDPAGTSNNTLPDYPHINLSNDFLYLTTNNIGGAAGSRAQVWRINIDQLADCVTASVNTFNYLWPVGQRVFVPVEGAREVMYWASHDNATTLRIFSWPETAAAPSSVTRAVAASTFGVNENCTGGTGNNDWWSNAAAPFEGTILGFALRGAVGHGRIHFYWPVTSDASHTEGHIHGAIFQENTSGAGWVVGSLLAQPVIFNNDFCFGLPQVSANERGDIGMVLGFGGSVDTAATCVGNGCSAARPAVGIDDDFTAGLGVFGAAGGNFSSVAAGTHNRTDSRYGDYFTIHPHEPCDNFFGATAYALNGGTSVTNVNARFVEFGRGRDSPCYSRWDDEDPVP